MNYNAKTQLPQILGRCSRDISLTTAEKLQATSITNPGLRGDTRMFLGHMERWCGMQIRLGQTGKNVLGSPTDVAADLAAYAQDVALEYSLPEPE